MSKLRDELQRKQEEAAGADPNVSYHSIKPQQDLYIMDRMSDFWCQQAVWSQNTFGFDLFRGPLGPIQHLQKEAKEVLDAYHDLENCIAENPEVHTRNMQRELIDCFFLVIDAARRSGLNYEQFMDLAFEKLKINKSRNWPRSANDNGQPIEHDRALDNNATEDSSCVDPNKKVT